MKTTIWIHYFLRTLVGLSFVALLFEREWLSAFYAAGIMALMLAPAILKKRFDIYLPLGLEVATVAFIFLTLFLGSLEDFYEKFSWWDGALHFGSGFLLGLLGFIFIYELNEGSKKLNLSAGFIAFVSIMFSVTIGALWEIAEFLFDKVTGAKTMESGLPDTMGDMIVNLISASMIAVFAYIWMKRRHKLPLTEKKIE